MAEVAARVLAAWAKVPAITAGTAVLAIAAGKAPRFAIEPFAAALHLERAARALAQGADLGEARATRELADAVRLVGQAGMIAALACMSPFFAHCVGEAASAASAAGADGRTMEVELPAYVRVPPPIAAPPEPPLIENLDEVLLAAQLRRAAEEGVPFCLPCLVKQLGMTA